MASIPEQHGTRVRLFVVGRLSKKRIIYPRSSRLQSPPPRGAWRRSNRRLNIAEMSTAAVIRQAAHIFGPSCRRADAVEGDAYNVALMAGLEIMNRLIEMGNRDAYRSLL